MIDALYAVYTVLDIRLVFLVYLFCYAFYNLYTWVCYRASRVSFLRLSEISNETTFDNLPDVETKDSENNAGSVNAVYVYQKLKLFLSFSLMNGVSLFSVKRKAKEYQLYSPDHSIKRSDLLNKKYLLCLTGKKKGVNFAVIIPKKQKSFLYLLVVLLDITSVLVAVYLGVVLYFSLF